MVQPAIMAFRSLDDKNYMTWLLQSPKRRKGVAKCDPKDASRPHRRPSVAEEFPTKVETARNFVESNGFHAHKRRQEEIGTCGSTISQIKEHLFHTVPELKDK